MERVFVGRIVKAFGIRGEVAIEATGGDVRRFAPKARLFFAMEGDEARTVATSRVHLTHVLVRFAEVPDRNGAEALVGRELFLDATSLPTLPDGSFYHYQLVGLEVVQSDGRSIGRIERVIEAGGTDLYRVQGLDGEWLIPARQEFVASIDLEAKRMTLTARDDLFVAQSREGQPDDGDEPTLRPGAGSRGPKRSNRKESRRPGGKRPSSASAS